MTSDSNKIWTLYEQSSSSINEAVRPNVVEVQGDKNDTRTASQRLMDQRKGELLQKRDALTTAANSQLGPIDSVKNGQVNLSGTQNPDGSFADIKRNISTPGAPASYNGVSPTLPAPAAGSPYAEPTIMSKAMNINANSNAAKTSGLSDAMGQSSASSINMPVKSASNNAATKNAPRGPRGAPASTFANGTPAAATTAAPAPSYGNPRARESENRARIAASASPAASTTPAAAPAANNAPRGPRGAPASAFITGASTAAPTPAAPQAAAPQSAPAASSAVQLTNKPQAVASATPATTNKPAAETDMFKKFHGSSYDPNSSADRKKMEHLQGLQKTGTPLTAKSVYSPAPAPQASQPINNNPPGTMLSRGLQKVGQGIGAGLKNITGTATNAPGIFNSNRSTKTPIDIARSR